jgi:hypothetical protein
MGKITVVSSHKADFKPVKISIELEIETFEEHQKFKEDIKYLNEKVGFETDFTEQLIQEIKDQL